MPEPLKVALIGLGMVAGTHVNAIAALSGKVALAGVLSRDPDRSAKFLEKHAAALPVGARVYRSVDEIAEDPEVDFVLLCTPPNARSEIVTRLVQAKKPILMEKPVERTTEAATAIVAACEAAGVPLGIVFQHRMRAAAQRLGALVASGALGKLALVEIAVPWWRPQGYYDEPGRGTYARDGGGVLISQAIHTLDLALTFTGPVGKVQAMARTTALHKMQSEDFVTAGLDFASGAVGTLVASTASRPGAAESITLHGTEGSALLRSGKLVVTRADGSTDTFGEEAATGSGADPMAFGHGWHQAVIADFAEALTTGRPPAIPGRAALAVHRLIDALIRSSQEGRAVTLSETP